MVTWINNIWEDESVVIVSVVYNGRMTTIVRVAKLSTSSNQEW